jgi:hypothetical protein
MQKFWRDGQIAHMGQTKNVYNISEENFSESGHLEMQDGDVTRHHDGRHENRL